MMKLRFGPISPFVRKVRVAALETGLAAKIAPVPTNPADPSSGLRAENPLEKIPALITEEGEALFDSGVICEYLDSLHSRAKLFPREGKARWSALRRMAQADGLLDAAVLRMYERRRPEPLRSQEWDERQKGKVTRAIAAFENEAPSFAGFDIGLITLACALGYLDFRFADEDWRKNAPKLAAWFTEVSKRPSMTETVPKEAG